MDLNDNTNLDTIGNLLVDQASLSSSLSDPLSPSSVSKVSLGISYKSKAGLLGSLRRRYLPSGSGNGDGHHPS